MDKKKTIIVAVLAVAAALVIALAAVMISSGKSNDSAQNTSQTQTETQKSKKSNENSDNASSETAEEEVKVTPTFMYFISASDEGYEQTNAMIEELKAQYGDKINFDIVNVDEHPEAKENFPVDGMTPALIMLNTSNDISGIEFKCNDKDRLTQDIENALNG